jgi:hypothetical protein
MHGFHGVPRLEFSRFRDKPIFASSAARCACEGGAYFRDNFQTLSDEESMAGVESFAEEGPASCFL